MENFRKIKKEYGLRQKDIAKITGVAQQLVSKWENGLREMPIRHAKKIAKELKINWKDLYDD